MSNCLIEYNATCIMETQKVSNGNMWFQSDIYIFEIGSEPVSRHLCNLKNPWLGKTLNKSLTIVVAETVLSSNAFPSCTDKYWKLPSASHAERRLVPTFILLKLEHLIPKCEAKSSWVHRSNPRIASLGCTPWAQVITMIPDFRAINLYIYF